MTESSAPPAGHSAGSILRAAREKQGLHIAALAAAIKVAPRKLDALENDRWDELPDATFTRALAQTVCRTLKIDPAPVLALLPSTDPGLLDTVSGHLNAPFSAGGARDAAANAAVRPMVIGGVVLLVAAVALSFLPQGFWPGIGESEQASQAGIPAPVAAVASAAVDAASQALQAAQVASEAPPAAGMAAASAAGDTAVAALAPATAAVQGAVQPVSLGAPGLTGAPQPAAPAPAGTAATAPLAAATPALAAAGTVPPAAATASAPRGAVQGEGPVRLRAVQATWVSARDANGTVLLSRLLDTGEVVAVNGAMPVRLVIGNAAGTELDFRGQKIDLAARTKDNVARLELQ